VPDVESLRALAAAALLPSVCMHLRTNAEFDNSYVHFNVTALFSVTLTFFAAADRALIVPAAANRQKR
jgi:hypothetical protein